MRNEVACQGFLTVIRCAIRLEMPTADMKMTRL
jgi:hypothetical protein